jgi:hypothetical protein
MKFTTILCLLGGTEALKMKIRSSVSLAAAAQVAEESAVSSYDSSYSNSTSGSYSYYNPVTSYFYSYRSKAWNGPGDNIYMGESKSNQDTGEYSSVGGSVSNKVGSWSVNDYHTTRDEPTGGSNYNYTYAGYEAPRVEDANTASTTLA